MSINSSLWSLTLSSVQTTHYSSSENPLELALSEVPTQMGGQGSASASNSKYRKYLKLFNKGFFQRDTMASVDTLLSDAKKKAEVVSGMRRFEESGIYLVHRELVFWRL